MIRFCPIKWLMTSGSPVANHLRNRAQSMSECHPFRLVSPRSDIFKLPSFRLWNNSKPWASDVALNPWLWTWNRSGWALANMVLPVPGGPNMRTSEGSLHEFRWMLDPFHGSHHANSTITVSIFNKYTVYISIQISCYFCMCMCPQITWLNPRTNWYEKCWWLWTCCLWLKPLSLLATSN